MFVPLADPPSSGGCSPLDFSCVTGTIVSKVAQDSVQQLANDVMEALGKAFADIGSMWVMVPTPNLVTSSSSSTNLGTPPGVAGITTALGYVQWIALVICVLSLIAFGVMLAFRFRRGEGANLMSRGGFVLLAAVLVSGAASIVSWLLPRSAPQASGTAAGYLQGSLWYYVGALAVASVIVAGIRMAWTQRATAGKELVQSLVTLIVVAGAGLTFLGILVAASDAFSVWVLNGSTNCDVTQTGDNACFGRNVQALIGITAASPIGVVGVLVLGTFALIATYVQVGLMIVRGALLVIMAGILPVTASFTNTRMGRQWFERAIGWTIAFILYKPAAALIYAAAFRLTASNAFGENLQQTAQGIWSVVTGIALMLIALVALPALMRFIAPMTSAAVGGATGALALAGAGGAMGMEAATGAIQRFGGRGMGGASSPSGASSAGASGGGGGSAGTGAAAAGKAGGTGAGAAGGGGAAVGGAAAAGAGGAAAGAGAAAAGPAAPIVLGAQRIAEGAQKGAAAARGAAEGAAGDSTGGNS